MHHTLAKHLFPINALCWSCCSTASLPRDEDSMILSHSLRVCSVDSSLRIVRIPPGSDSKPFPVLDEFLRTAADIPPEFREETRMVLLSITRSSRCHRIKAHRWRNWWFESVTSYITRLRGLMSLTVKAKRKRTSRTTGNRSRYSLHPWRRCVYFVILASVSNFVFKNK